MALHEHPEEDRGISVTIVSALAWPYKLPWKNVIIPARATGAVMAWSRASTCAKRNSVQEKMKAKAAAETIPGAASGQATLASAWKREQPSTSAASSSSGGICRKYAYIIQTVKGRAKTVYSRTSPVRVSTSVKPNHSSA